MKFVRLFVFEVVTFTLCPCTLRDVGLTSEEFLVPVHCVIRRVGAVRILLVHVPLCSFCH